MVSILAIERLVAVWQFRRVFSIIFGPTVRFCRGPKVKKKKHNKFWKGEIRKGGRITENPPTKTIIIQPRLMWAIHRTHYLPLKSFVHRFG